MGAALPRFGQRITEVRQVQGFSDFRADVQEAAARFPHLQAQLGQPKGSWRRSRSTLGPYALQAGIAPCHARARAPAEKD